MAKNPGSNAASLGFPEQPALGLHAVFGLLSHHCAAAAVTFKTGELLRGSASDGREEVCIGAAALALFEMTTLLHIDTGLADRFKE